MFWIVESDNQLDKLIASGIQDCYLEIITNNDLIHNSLCEVCAIYVQDINESNGYIIPTNHNDGVNEITFEYLASAFISKLTKIFVPNKKKALYFLNDAFPIFCIKTLYYINDDKIIDINKFNTKSHEYSYNIYSNRYNVNTLISLSKHYEKCNNFFNSLSISNIDNKVYTFYNTHTIKAFNNIESNGIKINEDLLKETYKLSNIDRSVHLNKIYSEYNIHTPVGRPSNHFNNVNFAALKKDDSGRSFIIPENDYLVEFDFQAYHPRLLADLVEYDIGDENIYEYVAKFLYKKADITEDEYKRAKELTFTILYKGVDNQIDVPFFNIIQEFRDRLWQKYEEKGYIKSPISGKKLRNIEKKSHILPYLCQLIETERNVLLINNINDILIGKQSKLILYTYDSFLIDYNIIDGKKVLNDIEKILKGENDMFSVNVKVGKNYAKML